MMKKCIKSYISCCHKMWQVTVHTLLYRNLIWFCDAVTADRPIFQGKDVSDLVLRPRAPLKKAINFERVPVFHIAYYFSSSTALYMGPAATCCVEIKCSSAWDIHRSFFQIRLAAAPLGTLYTYLWWRRLTQILLIQCAQPVSDTQRKGETLGVANSFCHFFRCHQTFQKIAIPLRERVNIVYQ